MEDVSEQYIKLKEELDIKKTDPSYKSMLYLRSIKENAIAEKELELQLELRQINEQKALVKMESLFQSLGGKEEDLEKLEILEVVANEVVEEMAEDVVETIPVLKVESNETSRYDNVVEQISKEQKGAENPYLTEQTDDPTTKRIDLLEKSIRKIIFAEHGGGLDPNKISADLIPTTTNTYSLGSASRTWKDLHLSGATLVIGDTSLASSELTVLDNVTLGTVSASKAVVVDVNKDITGFRNVNAAAYSIGGTVITSSAAELNLLDDVSGLVQSDFTKLAAVDATAAELNIIDAGATVTTPTVAGGDAFVMDDADVGMVQVDIDNVDTYLSATTKTLTNKTLTSPVVIGVATAPSLILTPRTVPSSPAPAQGQMYYNNDDNIVYVYDGSTWKPMNAGYNLNNMHVLTVGSGTYTKPVNVTALHITATGGGGGGSSGSDTYDTGAGGAAGGTLITFITGLPLAETGYAYVVGALGTGGTSGDGNNGVAGIATTLAINSISAGGGALGLGHSGGNIYSQAAGGTCTGGQSGSTLLITGGNGGTGGGGTADDSPTGISGGASYWGGGASAGYLTAGGDASITTYGAGGGAGDQNNGSNKTGGEGANGVIVIYEYR